jgi:NADH-quinone oxidoreductase subunit C
MSKKNQALLNALQEHFNGRLISSALALNEVTIEIAAKDVISICQTLRDEFGFSQLMDVCGVDYLEYGQADWDIDKNSTGFSRGVSKAAYHDVYPERPARFVVVYHLLSLQENQRLRVRTFAEGEPACVPSVIDIWTSANWYEREAFDLFGILFDGHPDLRRLLTDYGFIGHPFRKDFPISGHVEMRYDPEKARVIYEPVSIDPRNLVPRVIRHDNRYQ